ncbi:Sphingosine kinase 1 [Diplonema papillatum]|nr:Sphingosine kinase 1 [Diplonema papillatum]
MSQPTKHVSLPLANGQSLVLLEESLGVEGVVEEPKAKQQTDAVSLARTDVYGVSVAKAAMYVKSVTFSKRTIKVGDNGIPVKGEPWYLPGKFTETKLDFATSDAARQATAQVAAWTCPTRLRIFVIANPHSGGGNGQAVAKLVEQQAKYTLHSVTIQLTTARGEATQLAENLPLDDGETAIVAALGGDGTMCEVIEGLMRRKDCAQGRFTVAYIPAGSANAMAHMVGCGDPAVAIWALFKGETRKMDAFQFRQGGRTRYGVLSVTAGLVADIDIDSEICRCCGYIRVLVYALTKLLCCGCCCCCSTTHHRTQYPMRISWVPPGKPEEDTITGAPPSTPRYPLSDTALQWKHWEGPVNFFQTVSAPALDETMKLCPAARLDDGCLHVSWMQPTHRINLLTEFDRIEDCTHLENSRWEQHRAQAVHGKMLAPKEKVVLDGELCELSQDWSAECMPHYLNVVVGSGPLSAFSQRS